MNNEKRGGMISAVVAERLRKLRREAGLTRHELARESGVSWRCLANHEQGNLAGMRADILCAYADALDVSTDYILGRTDRRCAV